jgi:type IV secretion system protein VirB9
MKLMWLIATFLSATMASAAQQTSRVVKYHPNDIIAVKARMHYTTLIQLPATEKIMQAATGDKDFWIIDLVANYCFLHPAKADIHSNLNLITDKGNVYSFTLDDQEADTPDLKVIIEASDASTFTSAQNVAKFVPADQLATAQTEIRTAQAHAQQQVEQFRSEYPTKTLKFDYIFRDKKPFVVAAIYHDDQFTYIRSSAAEKFAIYQLADGKPDLVDFQLRDDTYVIPKVIEQGYLQLGKHKLAFQRRAQ